MPTLTMTPKSRCPLCGCRVEGFYVATFRINKRSLRTAERGGLMVTNPECRECGFENRAPEIRWTLDPESQATVDAYRARKGWEAW